MITLLDLKADWETTLK